MEWSAINHGEYIKSDAIYKSFSVVWCNKSERTVFNIFLVRIYSTAGTLF